MNDKTKEIRKIYERALDYFSNRTKGFKVELPETTRYFNHFTLMKIGSDLNYKLNIGDNDIIFLEISATSVSFDKSRVFEKTHLGSIDYQLNGKCINKRKVCLTNKRQQLELQEIINHVERSLRSNSINFIMDD